MSDFKIFRFRISKLFLRKTRGRPTLPYLAAQQRVDSGDESAGGDEWPALDGCSGWQLDAFVFDVRQRPVDVAALRRAAELAESAGHRRREVTETTERLKSAANALLRSTAHFHVLLVQIVQHL